MSANAEPEVLGGRYLGDKKGLLEVSLPVQTKVSKSVSKT